MPADSNYDSLAAAASSKVVSMVEVPFEATERQKLVDDLTIDDVRNAKFLLEARWQRRIAAQRWSLGLLIIEMRIRALKD